MLKPLIKWGSTMRVLLDGLYAVTALLAGVALVLIALIIIVQVVARVVSIQVPSADEFAAYALVATGFLALAPTYRRGEHIRVGLLVDRLVGQPRRWVEIAVLVASLLMAGWATWWSGRFVWDSYRFHDVSQGLIAVPLWIMQLAIPFGLGVLVIAFLDDLVMSLRGGGPHFMSAKQSVDDPMFER